MGNIKLNYKNIRSEVKRFKNEPRDFCYDLAMDLIKKSKKETQDNWYINKRTTDAILLILFCWNFAARKTKQLTREDVNRLLEKHSKHFKQLEGKTIINFDEKDEKIISEIYDDFKKKFDQTGTSKALHILNPNLFVMWDTKIRTELGKECIKRISNGEKSKHYITFLRGIRNIINKYNLNEIITNIAELTKKIDEFHYIKIVNPKL